MGAGAVGTPARCYTRRVAAAAGLESFAAYAAARGLTLEPGVHLPRTTPLLAEGELRSVDAVISGWLATYLEGEMALITREETTTDAGGGETKGDAHFTVAVAHVPKAKQFMPWLLCRLGGGGDPRSRRRDHDPRA